MKFAFQVLDKKKFVLCFIDAFLTNVFFYITPALLAWFTREPFTMERFGALIFWIIVTKIIAVSLNHIWIIYILKFENVYAKELQMAYFNRVLKMKPFRMNNVHNGFLKKQIDIISDEAEEFMEQIFETVSGFSVSVVMFLVQVISQDIRMFFVCLAMITGMVCYNLWLGKKVVCVQEDYNEKYAQYNSSYVDFLQNAKTVKRLKAGKFASQKNEELFGKVLPKLEKLNLFYSFRSNGINAFVYMMYVVVLINLYFQMKNGVNILSSLLFYATIFDLLRAELKDLTFLFIHYNKFQAATNQVEKIVGNEEEKSVMENWEKIEISNLHFKYNDETKTTISIPNFYLKKGEKISIVGKSGQGKTTFLNILAKDIEVENACYQIDGKVVEEKLDLAYISQEIDLFDLTIRENLCLGKKIEDSQLMQYLKEAGLEEWIEKSEKGLDTFVGERGLKLSAGQKQRLNIIRGILLDKEVYILDEPTSNLDKETEKLIVGLIEKYLKHKTVMIVTHRDEIKKICDRHYEFKNNIMQEYRVGVVN